VYFQISTLFNGCSSTNLVSITGFRKSGLFLFPKSSIFNSDKIQLEKLIVFAYTQKLMKKLFFTKTAIEIKTDFKVFHDENLSHLLFEKRCCGNKSVLIVYPFPNTSYDYY
jgi:hypothetical protein